MKRLKAMIVTFMAVLMLMVALQPALGSDGLRGYAVHSYDGEGNGNEVFNIEDADFIIAYADNAANSVSENLNMHGAQRQDDNYGIFSYSCLGDRAWDPEPVPEIGNNIFFVSEGDGWYWAAQVEMTDLDYTAESQFNLIPQYERLPQPYHEVTYIDEGTGLADVTINVKSPAYSAFGWVTDPAAGTFELFESYNVYVTDDEGASWTLLGTTDPVAGSYDSPIMPDATDRRANDPYAITTGLNEFTATGLDPASTYNFRVSANLAFPGTDVGTYETQGFGEASEDITPADIASEFGPGLLIPVVAIIGMFAAFTVYRRKKDE